MGSQHRALGLNEQQLDRCVQAGLCGAFEVRDALEAHTLRFAALVLVTSLPVQSTRLLAASKWYFALNPQDERDKVDELTSLDLIDLAHLRFKLEKAFFRELGAPHTSETERSVLEDQPRLDRQPRKQ